MDIKLSAQAREPKEKLDFDLVPAVLYGRGVASVSLKLKRGELEKVINQAGESNLITLEVDGKEVKVLIKEAQRSGLSSKLLHVDFFQVKMTEKISTEIPFNFIGESRAVKELSASLIKEMDSVEVECLPGDLVDHVDIDISSLKEYHDEISTDDLVLPKGLELQNKNNRIIVTVIPPKIQEVVEEAPKEEKVVIETKDKKEEEK